MIFTTSWDDGHRLDVKLAALLDRYGIKGTFYIAKDFLPERLSDSEIVEIGKKHEIGAHTLTHLELSKADVQVQEQEIAGSKAWIESIMGKPCEGFCYPKGRYNSDSVRLTEGAGYRYARSVEIGVTRVGADQRFIFPTTLHLYPYPFRVSAEGKPVWRDLLRPIINHKKLKNSVGWTPFVRPSWSRFAKAVFDKSVQRKVPYFHLWGHSWEIEKFGLWSELESFLAHVAQSSAVTTVTNAQAVNQIFPAN